MRTRHIVHVDMDAFFASIEQRNNPAFRGRPVVVGADPKGGRGRGVVSTCSYEARAFGIRSAMPISEAYRRCQSAIFLPVDMAEYSKVSGEIYDILYDFTPEIEPVSIDEAFLDISGSHHLFGTPLETGKRIKLRIREMTGLTASIGLAPTKIAAKIASDLKKPDGLVEVTEEGMIDFLRPLNVRKIWGLGEKAEKVLNGMGIRTIGELARCDKEKLISVFGVNGAGFWELANGIDERAVETGSESKSVSNEVTFEKDTHDRERIARALSALSEKVSDRLRRDGLKGRTITLKIRLAGFHTYTRSATVPEYTNFFDTIYGTARRLYEDFETRGEKVRLIGVKVLNLCPADSRESLFDANGPDTKKELVHKALDAIRSKYGDEAVYRAGSKG